MLPKGFHRIRHYGLLASGTKAVTIPRARELIAAAMPPPLSAQQKLEPGAGKTDGATPEPPAHPCPSCGGSMVIIETFEAGCTPRNHPTAPAPMKVDTS